ncbi:MAG: hypothetical protein GWP05_07565, partial [Anaerolineaceae bacterium]|nr:hypothetical protein [Anaerolineaceae bacterium]
MRRAGALILWSFCIVLVLLIADQALAVERFPPPDFIETGHQLPVLDQRPLRMPGWMEYVHVAALALGLVLAAVFVLKLRSRTAIRWLSIGSLAYFGFYLGGCVCPVAA